MKLTYVGITCFVVLFGMQMVAHVFAAYTETVLVTDNEFKAGTYEFQLSSTDSNADGIADTQGVYWSTIPKAVWTSPEAWVPGQKFSRSIFIRAGGNVDIPKLHVRIKRKTGSGDPVQEHIRLTKAWYDRNANGTLDDGEDLLPGITQQVDADGNQKVTLHELATFSPLGTNIILESEGRMLPGSITNNVIGGSAGTGKGLTFEWELMSTLPTEFGGSRVWVDFEIFSHYLE